MESIQWDYSGKLDTFKNCKSYIEHICSVVSKKTTSIGLLTEKFLKKRQDNKNWHLYDRIHHSLLMIKLWFTKACSSGLYSVIQKTNFYIPKFCHCNNRWILFKRLFIEQLCLKISSNILALDWLSRNSSRIPTTDPWELVLLTGTT